jgi:hypothetical protein
MPVEKSFFDLTRDFSGFVLGAFPNELLCGVEVFKQEVKTKAVSER